MKYREYVRQRCRCLWAMPFRAWYLWLWRLRTRKCDTIRRYHRDDRWQWRWIEVNVLPMPFHVRDSDQMSWCRCCHRTPVTRLCNMQIKWVQFDDPVQFTWWKAITFYSRIHPGVQRAWQQGQTPQRLLRQLRKEIDSVSWLIFASSSFNITFLLFDQSQYG